MAQQRAAKSSKSEAIRVVMVVPESDWVSGVTDALYRAGFEAHAVMSADSAALATAHWSPGAILVDASFLEHHGFRFMDTLRLGAPQVPILVLSEAGDAQGRLKALLMGAEDCVPRPCSEQEVVVRVRRAVERRQGIRRLAVENQSARERGTRMNHELGELRGQLQRNVAMLHRAVDFHQRLDPDQGQARMLEGFLLNLHAQLGVERLAYLGRRFEDAAWFTVLADRGLPLWLGERIRAHTRSELASLLASTRTPLVLDRLATIPGLRLELGILASGGFTVAVPLLRKQQLQGILLLGEAREGGAPSDDTLQLAQLLCSAVAPAVTAQELREHERAVGAQALGMLVSTLEARDPYLQGHSQRVAHISEGLAERMGLTGTDLSMLTVAAILHDIGRFEVDAALWSKSEPLTPSDWDLIRRHPQEGARIAGEANWPGQVLGAIRHHHERWDGSGYPSGLQGKEIPLEARVLAVADTLEALTSPRAYRGALTLAEAIDHLRAEAGRKYDPEVVAGIVETPTELLRA